MDAEVGRSVERAQEHLYKVLVIGDFGVGTLHSISEYDGVLIRTAFRTYEKFKACQRVSSGTIHG